MNTDPNKNLGNYGNKAVDEGAAAYLRYFYNTNESINARFDPTRLTGDKLGFTLDDTSQWSAYYYKFPFRVSLDHAVSNFARSYFNTASACERIRLAMIDLDHAALLCALNIQRIK